MKPKINLFDNSALVIRAITQANIARNCLIDACDNISSAGHPDKFGEVLDFLEQALRDTVEHIQGEI